MPERLRLPSLIQIGKDSGSLVSVREKAEAYSGPLMTELLLDQKAGRFAFPLALLDTSSDGVLGLLTRGCLLSAF